MARPGRVELPTLCLEGRRSIQLSYGRVAYPHCITELGAFVSTGFLEHLTSGLHPSGNASTKQIAALRRSVLASRYSAAVDQGPLAYGKARLTDRRR